MSARRRMTGELTVALPPEEAFDLFTPRGEESWAHGWKPRFPAGAEDDSEPGTVFETGAHGEVATWVVLERHRGRSISYARITPGSRAGTVSVALTAGGEGSTVTVTYDLTALSEYGERELTHFEEGYPAYLDSWQQAIAARKGMPSPMAPPPDADG